MPYEVVSDLEGAIGAFVDFYNHRRYHKALGNLTPADVLQGHREDILACRRDVQKATFERRRRYNQTVWAATADENAIVPCYPATGQPNHREVELSWCCELESQLDSGVFRYHCLSPPLYRSARTVDSTKEGRLRPSDVCLYSK